MRKPYFAYAKIMVQISCTVTACYSDSTISLLPKSAISSLSPSSVAVQPSFVSDLVGIPEDRFSCDVALLKNGFQLVEDTCIS